MLSRKEKDSLIRSCLAFAIATARKFWRPGMDMDELIGAANLGLVEAAERFDPARNLKFTTYAVWWIRAELFLVIEQTEGKRLTRDERKIFYHTRDAQKALGINATDEEIAAFLGVDIESMRAFRARRTLSLDAPALHKDNAPGDTFVNIKIDEGAVDAQAQLEHAEDLAALRAAMEHLSERHRKVITDRFLIDEVKDRVQIGNELGISRERTRQVELQAKEVLRRLVTARVG